MKRNDGGPAFPNEYKHWEYDDAPHLRGMTLRDYFAAVALQGLMLRPYKAHDYSDMDASISAYEIADAMLKARDE